MSQPGEERVRGLLGDPDLAWLVDRVTARLSRGQPIEGTVLLEAPSAGQRRAVARLLGRPPSIGRSVAVSLTALSEALRRAGIAPDLRTAVEALHGPVPTRAAARQSEEQRRTAALATAQRCRHAGSDWFGRWLDALVVDGTVTKLLRSGRAELLGQAAAVLDQLPAEDVPLPVLAQRAVGDTKALTASPLAGLVLRAVREWTGQEPSAPRALWRSVGVVVDDLASQVLVLNLRAGGGPLSGWLNDAAELGIPMRVTLHQLTVVPPTLQVDRLWVCENPAVLRVAAADLGPECPPLVCTEGVPSVACHRLIAAAAAGAAVHWRGDLDWTGVRTTADAVTRYGAAPWRMSVVDYLDGLAESPGVPLRGPVADSPWEPALAAAMAERGRAVMEEQLLPALLSDLAREPVR